MLRKIQKKCNIEKEELNFNKGRGECKECMSKYKKEHALKNADKISAYQKEYRKNNSEGLKEYGKKYRENNTQLVAYKKKYAKENSEKINEYNRSRYGNRKDVRDRCKKYRESNKEKSKEYQEKYYQENRNVILSNVYKNKKRRIKNDPLYKLYIRISGSIRDSIQNGGYSKRSRTHDILGCTYEEFKIYIESKFESWMNWDNRGLYNGEPNYGWDIDHIIPSSTAKTEDELIR